LYLEDVQEQISEIEEGSDAGTAEQDPTNNPNKTKKEALVHKRRSIGDLAIPSGGQSYCCKVTLLRN
jgi:hypothetical protein